jgi:hypothetical protein
MAQQETRQPDVDPAIERMVRGLLRGRDGAVRLRFRVSGSEVSMELLDRERAARQPSEDRQGPAFPVWLGDVLRDRHLSQEAAARLVGVSLKTVNRWVNGRTEPRMRELRRLQDAFGVVPPL